MNYSNEIKEKVIALLRDNKTAKLVKQETGVSIATINKWKKEAGLVRARKVDTKDSEDIEQELYITEQYQKHIEKMIEEADKNGDLDTVAQLCKQLLSLDPNSIEARKRLAKVAMIDGKTDYSESLCNEILDLNPDEVFAYEMLLQIAKRRGDQEPIKDIAQLTIDVDYLNLPARRTLLSIAKKEGNKEQEIQMMQEILMLDPKDTQIRYLLIQMAMEDNNFELLCKLLKEAEKLNVIPSLEYLARIAGKKGPSHNFVTKRKELRDMQPEKSELRRKSISHTDQEQNEPRKAEETENDNIDLFRKLMSQGDVTLKEAQKTLKSLESDNSIRAIALKTEIYLRIFNNPKNALKVVEESLKREENTRQDRSALSKILGIIRRAEKGIEPNELETIR